MILLKLYLALETLSCLSQTLCCFILFFDRETYTN